MHWNVFVCESLQSQNGAKLEPHDCIACVSDERHFMSYFEADLS